MTTMELLTIPGLDNGPKLKTLRQASKLRSIAALNSQAAKMSMMNAKALKKARKY